jgi:hypothetical protein
MFLFSDSLSLSQSVDVSQRNRLVVFPTQEVGLFARSPSPLDR